MIHYSYDYGRALFLLAEMAADSLKMANETEVANGSSQAKSLIPPQTSKRDCWCLFAYSCVMVHYWMEAIVRCY